MDTMLSILLGLAVVLFLFIAVVFLFEPIRNLFNPKRRGEVDQEEDLPFDYIPSRTQANTRLVWEDRRKGPRRSGRDRRQKEDETPEEKERREEKDRRGSERRETSMRPPYPE